MLVCPEIQKALRNDLRVEVARRDSKKKPGHWQASKSKCLEFLCKQTIVTETGEGEEDEDDAVAAASSEADAGSDLLMGWNANTPRAQKSAGGHRGKQLPSKLLCCCVTTLTSSTTSTTSSTRPPRRSPAAPNTQ